MTSDLAREQVYPAGSTAGTVPGARADVVHSPASRLVTESASFKDLETEISRLSKKHAISSAQVRGLIDCFGANEDKLNAAVERLKQSAARK